MLPLKIIDSTGFYGLTVIICGIAISILCCFLWKLNKNKKKTEHLLTQHIDFQNKVLKLQNAVSKEMLDYFGNKMAAMVNTYEIIKDINQKEIKNLNDLEKFCDYFEYNYSILLHGFDELIWANNIENRNLQKTIDKIDSYTKTIAPEVAINIETNYCYNFEMPRYWNRQFFLLIKEIITNSISAFSLKSMDIEIIGLQNGIVKTNFKNPDNTFYFDADTINSQFENAKRLANSIEAQLEFNVAPNMYYASITTKIPLFGNSLRK